MLCLRHLSHQKAIFRHSALARMAGGPRLALARSRFFSVEASPSKPSPPPPPPPPPPPTTPTTPPTPTPPKKFTIPWGTVGVALLTAIITTSIGQHHLHSARL